MRVSFLLLLGALAMVLVLVLACGSETEDAAGIGAVDDDNDDDDDDDDTPTDMYSEECSIDYGTDPGCEESTPACQVVRLLNQDRYGNPDESDCAPVLLWDEDLAEVALAHSVDMCERSFFAHENPDGKDPFERMNDAGINWFTAGENIGKAYGYGLDETLVVIEDSFMNEPECSQNHRSNILQRNFTHVGVGVYQCPDGWIYITQDFAAFNYEDIRQDPHEYCPNFSP